MNGKRTRKVRETFDLPAAGYTTIANLCALRGAAINSDFAKRIIEKFNYKGKVRVTVELLEREPRRSGRKRG